MPNTITTIGEENLDNTIAQTAEGEYVSDNGLVRTEFYEVGNRVVFDRGGRRIAWTPSTMKYVDADGVEDMLFTVQDVPLETKANYARYNRAMPDVDDWFTQENDRIKHSILLQGFQRDPMPWLTGPIDFVFGGRLEFDADLRVRVGDLIVVNQFETDGSIDIIDTDGSVVFTLPAIVAYDSGIPERSTVGGRYRVTSNDGGILAFDIVVDNEWISSTDRVYPIIIDPTIVVTDFVDFVSTDRKSITLPNGTKVVATLDVGLRGFTLYKSTDNGNTWVQFLAQPNIQASGFQIGSISIDGKSDNTIAVAYIIFASPTHRLKHMNVNLSGSISNHVEISSNVTDGGVSVCCGTDGTLYVAYSVGVNAMYTWSTTNGATWNPPVNLSNETGGLSHQRATILLDGNSPVITWAASGNDASGWYDKVFVSRWNGSSFVTKAISGGNNGENMGPPSVLVKRYGANIGRILIAFHVTRSDDRDEVIVYRSDDGFNTYTTMLYASASSSSDENYLPKLSEDPNGNIYIFYGNSVGPKFVQQICPNGTTTFGTATTFASGSSVNSLHVDRYAVASSFGVVYKQGTSNMYQNFMFNMAPNAPILNPVANFDATEVAYLTWTFSDPNSFSTQSAFQFLVKRASDGVTVVDSSKVPSTNSIGGIPAGALTNGVQYQWQCRTWDDNDVVGQYSALATFNTSARPTVAITAPSVDGSVVTLSNVDVSWTYSDPEATAQYSYQIIMTDNFDAVLWDSGVVVDSTTRKRTVPISLVNNGSYKIKMTVWDSTQIASAMVVRTFTVSFAPPTTPTMALTTGTGYIGVQITNPAPSGSQPAVSYNNLYRRISGSISWTRIAIVPSGGSYSDYNVASGVTYEYMAQALGINGTIANSSISSRSISLTGIWIHSVTSPSTTMRNFIYDGGGRNDDWEQEVSLTKFAGRKMPIAEFGDQEERKITISMDTTKGSGDMDAIRSLAARKETLCYRDGRGRKMFGIIQRLPSADEAFGYNINIEIVGLDYNEDV